MQRKLTALSRHYLVALREHLKQSSPASARAAQGLGREAGALGVSTLGLANIHDAARGTLRGLIRRNKLHERVKDFFAAAIVPLAPSLRPARKTKVHLEPPHETSRQRLVDLRTRNSGVLSTSSESDWPKA